MKRIIRSNWIGLAMVALLAGPALKGQETATSKPDTEPTRLTLHVHGELCANVVDEIKQQSGYKFSLGSNLARLRNVPVTLDADHQPFWTVATDLCAQCNGRLGPQPDGGIVVFPNALPVKAPVAVVAGPLLLLAVRSERIMDFNVSDAERDWCAVRLEVLWEPKLKVLYYEDAVIPDDAVDENGLSLVPPPGISLQRILDTWGRHDHTIISVPGGSWRDCSVRIVAPDHAGRRIARLKGACKMGIAGKSDQLEIPDVGKLTADRKTFSLTLSTGRKLSVDVNRSQPNALELFLRRVRTDETDEQWRLAEVMQLSARIIATDSSGKSDIYGSWVAGAFGSMTMHASYAQVNSMPAKLVIEMPTAVTEVDVPFEFKDLPLP